MREIIIMLCENGKGLCDTGFAGYAGEHNNTCLRIHLPEAFLSADIRFYQLSFVTERRDAFLSEELYAENREITFMLPSGLMVEGDLSVQLRAFGHKAGELIRLAESEVFTLEIGEGIDGGEPLEEKYMGLLESSLTQIDSFREAVEENAGQITALDDRLSHLNAAGIPVSNPEHSIQDYLDAAGIRQAMESDFAKNKHGLRLAPLHRITRKKIAFIQGGAWDPGDTGEPLLMFGSENVPPDGYFKYYSITGQTDEDGNPVFDPLILPEMSTYDFYDGQTGDVTRYTKRAVDEDGNSIDPRSFGEWELAEEFGIVYSGQNPDPGNLSGSVVLRAAPESFGITDMAMPEDDNQKATISFGHNPLFIPYPWTLFLTAGQATIPVACKDGMIHIMINRDVYDELSDYGETTPTEAVWRLFDNYAGTGYTVSYMDYKADQAQSTEHVGEKYITFYPEGGGYFNVSAPDYEMVIRCGDELTDLSKTTLSVNGYLHQRDPVSGVVDLGSVVCRVVFNNQHLSPSQGYVQIPNPVVTRILFGGRAYVPGAPTHSNGYQGTVELGDPNITIWYTINGQQNNSAGFGSVQLLFGKVMRGVTLNGAALSPIQSGDPGANASNIGTLPLPNLCQRLIFNGNIYTPDATGTIVINTGG